MCVLTGLSGVLNYLNAAGKASEDIVKEVETPGFKEKLGFMATIKDKLSELGNLLQNPETVPNVWDFLLPDWLGSNKEFVKGICERVFGGKVKLRSNRPCRLVIFVDDLDRCPPEKSVEVLQSLVLLTEGTPFVLFLAIDPRVVVAAIESVNDKFFNSAGASNMFLLLSLLSLHLLSPLLSCV